MPNIVVVGTQWGDEGKGKLVDILAARVDAVVRYQGGNNAGHTVVVGDRKYVFHSIPSAVLRPPCICVLGCGMVIDPAALLDEIESLANIGVSSDHLFISKNAHLVMPYHPVLDRVAEARRGARSIGTTGKGIGPAYADKAARMGIRVGDLMNEAILRAKLEDNVADKNRILADVYDAPSFAVEPILQQCQRWAGWLAPYVTDTPLLLHALFQAGRSVLFEGAQAAMLDVDQGTYPYVTSSSTTSGGACVGAGVPPTRIHGVLGVAKAYTTRVGSGPFPTEMTADTSAELRERGHEYGSTTGRPRRCGWFDAVAVRYAVRINGLDALALTKLDVLDAVPLLKVCTGYRYRGEVLTEFPSDGDVLAGVEPVYEELSGWLSPTSRACGLGDLPAKARSYLERLEELCGVPLAMISTGPARDDTIVCDDSLLARWFPGLEAR